MRRRGSVAEASERPTASDPLECRLIPIYVRLRRKLSEAVANEHESEDDDPCVSP